MLIGPAVVVAVGALNFGALRVNRYPIEVPRRVTPVPGLRVAVASDFHLGAATGASFVPRFVDRANAPNADVLLLAGEVLEGDPQDGATTEFEEHA